MRTNPFSQIKPFIPFSQHPLGAPSRRIPQYRRRGHLPGPGSGVRRQDAHALLQGHVWQRSAQRDRSRSRDEGGHERHHDGRGLPEIPLTHGQ